MAVAPASAANIVAEYLKSPDDLSRLAGLRTKLHRESLTLEAKLKTGAKEQLEAIRDGLLKLQATKRDVQGVREAFAEVERLCKGSDAEVAEKGELGAKGAKAFRVISEVSQIHRNFVQADTVLNQLEMMPPKIEELAHMLQQARDDLFGPATRLLSLHYHISELETFRNETLQTARTCSSDVRQQLMEFFSPLDGLVKEFEGYLFLMGERAIDLVREGREGVIVKLVKIIEKESREDEKAAAIRLAKRANLEGAARFRSVIANARVIKLYRPKLLEAMDRSTQELFAECWNRFGTDGRYLDFLTHLEWIYKDLEQVKELMVPLFPQDYNIYRFFVKSYHKHLGQLLRDNILATDPEASALLTLYQFTQEYTTTMKKELKVDEEWLKPSLLGGKEQAIIDDYLSLITRKIDEWSANLMSDEVRAFVARADAPEKDADGLYGINYASTLFMMLTQQCDLAADSGQGAILAKAVFHSAQTMIASQATWLRVVEGECSKQIQAKNPDEIAPGLTEYVIALCNELIKSADLAEALGKRFEALVSTKYKAGIREEIDNAVNGYLDVSARCGGILVQFVFEDLKPAVKELFSFPAWYAEGTCTIIIETMRDYLSDYAELLNPNFFEARLLPDLIDRFLVSYIGALRRATKLRMPGAADRMKSDIDEFRVMIGIWLKENEWEEKAGVLDLILALLTSSSTMVFLPYWSFAKACGPNFGFLESVMKARDDLDKSDVSGIMESARRKVKNEGLPDVPMRVETSLVVGGAAALLWGRVGGAASGLTSSQMAPSNSSSGTGWSTIAQNYLGSGWRDRVVQ
ncbi:exocyst complex component Sec6 [Microstroma glucosiphilum]|uniref:Exocyst complex component Sec6 n=1 Tax=Pseudomicrostroma glucosiphilum TaxID=1684307 RepID=A0A316U801_9BASI|nr:exocyst complex component Sec6 [Pseudomicrostroma glucosiphilum]PWN20968.1 exocyst complex component Sec6 [Pseudomicrostroma glucosiphilum]